MRRADLQVGGEYYYHSSPNWLKNGYRGCKVVVVSEGAWKKMRHPNIRDGIVRVPGGNGVLVDLYSNSTLPISYRTVVQASQLRGPWEETSKLVKDRSQERRDKARQDEEEADRTERLRTIYIDQARAAGLMVHPDRNDLNRVTLLTEDLVTYLSTLTH